MPANKMEKKARNTLLFYSGSVGSNKANQFILKQIPSTSKKVASETKNLMKCLCTRRPKYCNTTPKKIMIAPRMLSIGWKSSSGQPAACSRLT